MKNLKLFALCALLAVVAVPALAADVPVTANISASETWTSDNVYILTQPIYVTDGATLTIEAGTVVRGETESSSGANDPGALIIARGAKINALGTVDAPVVFTDLFDDNLGEDPGTFPYSDVEGSIEETANWGGVIVLDRSWVARGTGTGPDPTAENQIEGLTATGGLGLYGNCAVDNPDALSDPSVCDDRSSGVMNYVSIRYGGFNIAADNEINGLTLGAVGRLTDFNYIEVFHNQDDGVEFFGGAAHIKHVAVVNVGDDSFDFDEGWRGKAQFVFAMQGLTSLFNENRTSDKGAEQDGGGSPDGSQPFAIPTFYNATYVGLGNDKTTYTDKDKNTALHFRDNAGGRYYNSAFLDFGGASMIIEGGSTTSTDPNTSGERTQTAYTVDNEFFVEPDSEFQLELRNNEFWCVGRRESLAPGDLSIPTGDATPWGASSGDAGKIHHDNGAFSNAAFQNVYGACADPLPIGALTRTDYSFDPTLPDSISAIDPRPVDTGSTVNLVSGALHPYPNDGFFEAVSYAGAFAPDENWLEGWSTMARVGYFPAKPTVTVSSNISTSQTWTADTIYELDQPIYVTDGATLTIEPCTVVRGQTESSSGANDPGAIVVARGSKINAVGRPDCPIVFTDLNDDNVGGNGGTFPYSDVEGSIEETANWGGVIVLDRSWVARGTGTGPDPTAENQIEGLTATGGLGLYGNCAVDNPDALSDPSVCDDRSSGAMNFVSIRYGGFNIAADNEINGLTLGAVGRLTDFNYIEVFHNQDDGVEFFGGAAHIKHVAVVNVGDDSFDFDEGWRGKAQYVFAMQGLTSLFNENRTSDKGAEQDGGGSPDGSQPFAIPTFYNATYVGLGNDKTTYTDKDKNTALHFRDNAGGRYYNSAFLDFGGASMIIEGGSTTSTDPNTSGERTQTAYTVDNEFFVEPDSEFQLELRNNEFWCVGRRESLAPGDLSIPTGDATPWGASSGDAGKIHHDNGAFSNASFENAYSACADALPIRTLVRTDYSFDPTLPDSVSKIDPRPAASSVLTTGNTRAWAQDGYFKPASFQGAFEPGNNWLAGWSTMQRLGYFPTCAEDSSAIPNTPSNLQFTSKTTVNWDAAWGGNLTGYDLLRSGASDDFSTPTCVENNDPDTTAADAAVPAAGNAFFYLVRSVNDCGNGLAGGDWQGSARSAGTCN